MTVEVKICGLTTPADVEAVNAAGADYAGFVFYEKSKRRVGEKEAEHLLARLNPGITSVAVCVNPDTECIARIEALGFDVIQIHGGITKKLLEAVRIPVWQAVNLSEKTQLEQILLHPKIDGYLIDGAKYGAGKTFGWGSADMEARHAEESALNPTVTERPELLRDEIRQRIDDRRFILAGGLSLENVSEGIRLFTPDVVDVSSGVEWNAERAAGELGGRKDPAKVLEFVRKVRES